MKDEWIIDDFFIALNNVEEKEPEAEKDGQKEEE